jgi:Zn-finger nucleic acid-binding protein
MQQQTCPVCNTSLKDVSYTNGGGEYFSCPRCGDFALSKIEAAMIHTRVQKSPRTVVVLSYAFRKMQKSNHWPLITSEVVSRIIEGNILPTPAEQAEILIIWLGENIEAPGDAIDTGNSQGEKNWQK